MGGVAALAVDPDDYVAASSAFARVRGDSRQVVSTLAGALDGSSGMGGSDNAGTEWAHGYDEAAQQGLAATAALSNACGQVSLLLGASGQNHAHADAASTIGGGDSTLVMGPVIPPLAAPSLPSAAGGSGGGPPGWSLVESLVGYAWPNGHQDQLRTAQRAWQTAAESLTAGAAPVPGAVSRLGAQQSPEIPAAVATCQQVGTHLGDLSSVLTQIGGSCGEYAAHLDQAHHEILSELKDLIIQTAAIEAGGAVLAFFTAGLDEIAAQAAVAARIAIVAARIRRIIEVLIEAARLLPQRCGGSAVGRWKSSASSNRLSKPVRNGRPRPWRMVEKRWLRRDTSSARGCRPPALTASQRDDSAVPSRPNPTPPSTGRGGIPPG